MSFQRYKQAVETIMLKWEDQAKSQAHITSVYEISKTTAAMKKVLLAVTYRSMMCQRPSNATLHPAGYKSTH